MHNKTTVSEEKSGRSGYLMQGFMLFCACMLVLTTQQVTAGEAHIVDAQITSLGDGRYRIDASVEHADTGWEHYADRWDVLAEDGSVLGVRELAHPHVNEQPFTRSLTLTLPPGTRKVILRANDSEHGLGGQQFELEVPG